jgi:hypothetical protein
MDRIHPIEEHPEFWSSADALPQTPEHDEVVNTLIDRVARDPLAAYANHDGVRIIKEPSNQKNGRTFPALRLAYSLGTRPRGDGDEEVVVVLLQVRPYDETADAQEGWLRPGSTLEQ